MGWAVASYSQSRTSIAMQATTATDDSGSVQYNFICASGSNCNESGWQSSSQYTATELLAGNSYSFQVLARDAYNNTTQAVASATTATNNPPLTSGSSVSTQEDASVTIDLTSISSDPDGDILTYSTQSTANGTLAQINGVVTYTPNSNFNGADSFNYTVTDSFGDTASGIVTISVAPVNDAPVATASAPANSESLTVSFSSANSFDPDSSDTLSYYWDFGDGNSSTLESPTYSYSTYGSYSVILTVTDNHNSSDSSSLAITLTDRTASLPEIPGNLSYAVDKVVTGRGKNKTVSGSIALTWDVSSFASGYNIWQCTEMTSGKGKRKTTSCIYSQIGTAQNTSYSANLTNSTVRFKVAASNDNGVSDFSNEIIVRP